MQPTMFDRTVALMPKISIEHSNNIQRIKTRRDLLACSMFDAKNLYEGWVCMNQFYNTFCTSDSARAQYIEGYYLARRLACLKGTPGGTGYIEGIR